MGKKPNNSAQKWKTPRWNNPNGIHSIFCLPERGKIPNQTPQFPSPLPFGVGPVLLCGKIASIIAIIFTCRHF